MITSPLGSAEAGVVLVQVIHHANERRAQVCSIFGIGVEPPMLDRGRGD